MTTAAFVAGTSGSSTTVLRLLGLMRSGDGFCGKLAEDSCETGTGLVRFVGVDVWPSVIARGPLGTEDSSGEEGR